MFRAIRVHDPGSPARPLLEHLGIEVLSEGDVVLRASHSGINFKDALAVTGRGKILRRLPLIPGIDVAGVVQSSGDARFHEGDRVLVNGMGLGETRDGGFSELVRVPADLIVPLPEGLSPREAMSLGTAGFTAALALHRMEQIGQRPENGKIVVTGASGGVGSIAVSILAGRGYEVLAVSGREEYHDYLRGLGAAEVLSPSELELGHRAMESSRFGGAIDNVGGDLLAGLIRHMGLWGSIACIGMAASADLSTTVFPLILRGVNLLGVSSANCPMPLRTEVWNRLGNELKPRHLAEIVTAVVGLEAIPEHCERLLSRQCYGRIVVDHSLNAT